MRIKNRVYEDIVYHLIEAEADVDLEAQNGFTPLTAAAQRGHEGVVRKLISAGADIDLSDQNGFTPLTAAAKNRHTDVVKQLIVAKANINKTSSSFLLIHQISEGRKRKTTEDE
jgi:ankyrin repeat protein